MFAKLNNKLIILLFGVILITLSIIECTSFDFDDESDDSIGLNDMFANPDGYIIIKKSSGPVGGTVLRDILGKRKRNVGGIVLKDLLGKKKRVSVVGGTVLKDLLG